MSPEVEPSRSERVAFRVKPETKSRLETAARDDDVTISKWVERAIRDALDAAEKKRRN